MKRFFTVVALAATTALAGGLFAAPAWAKPVIFTDHEHKATTTFHDLIPCVGNGQELGTITTTETGVFHVTAAGIDANGDLIPPYHVTGTFTGTFVAVPDDSSLPTFTGRFTTSFGDNSNSSGVILHTDTFHVIGHGSDGSTINFHDTFHVTVSARGDLIVVFDKPRCG
jgi:hypothetical protein